MVGRSIDRYQRLEQIGSGGMSVVYRARDTALEREVAIKVLHPHLARRDDSRRRFRREATAVAKLRHPNILEIFDFSADDDDESFIVTEYIQGQTLRAFAEATPFHPPELAAMAVHELACALEHAHATGVIHRDLKPENVMIRQDGVIKLMDFGIAKVVDRDERMTMTGALVGSPAHMAPEIIEGQEAGREADIFSLGTILYWLCCRKLPFVGNNTTQTLKLILDARYPDPRLENPAVSDELAAIIARCLAREPAARFPTAAALRDALAAALAPCELQHVTDELRAFFADPPGYRARIEQRLIGTLLEQAGASATGPQRNYARALGRLDRVLALDPKNERAHALIALTRRQDRRRRQVATLARAGAAFAALGLLSLAAVEGLEAWKARRPPMASPVADPPRVVSTPPPTAAPSVSPTPPAVEPPKPVVVAPPPSVEPPERPRPDPRIEPKKPVRPPPVVAIAPPAPVERRKVRLTLEPKGTLATIKVGGVAETHKGSSWDLELPVGAHQAHVECAACLPEPIDFAVPSAQEQPRLRPIILTLQYGAQVEVEVEHPAAVATVNGRSMHPGDDPRKRRLEIPLPEGRRSVSVTVEVKEPGKPLRTWSQPVVAGGPTLLRPDR